MTGKTKTVEYKFEHEQNHITLGNLKMEAKELYGDNWVADDLVFLVGDVAVVHGSKLGLQRAPLRDQGNVHTDYHSLRKFCFEHSKEPGDRTLHVGVVLSTKPAGFSV